MIITGNSHTYLDWFVLQLSNEFSMIDLRPLHYFLGIEVFPFDGGLFLYQIKYANDLLSRANMQGCKPISTLMAVKSRSLPSDNDPFQDPKHYRSIVGGLQYLIFT